MRNPPILISVIGFFALLAGFGYLFFGLRVLGFDWFGLLGDLPRFESVGLWGWLEIARGCAWVRTVLALWRARPVARMVALFVRGFSRFAAVLAFFRFPGPGIGFAMSLLPIIILLYLNSRDVKAAFGEAEPTGEM